jgi:hypothetical protein
MHETVRRHMYAPTAATAGDLLCHHQTQVVENQVADIATTTAKDAMNAQGESPPVKRRPAQKKRLREGYS